MSEDVGRATVARVLWWFVCSVGLGVSALLLYEYVTPAAQFCGPGGGCDQVRHSAYASLLGVPTPAFGVAFFAAALVASFVERLRPMLLVLAGLGALASFAFVAVQAFVIDAFCRYCIVADVAALMLLALAIPLRRAPVPRPNWAIAAPSALVGFALPILLGMTTSAASDAPLGGPLPDEIAREQRPGVATVVEFLDFECPYCREQHETMKKVLADYGDRVRIVYKHVPLRQIHPHAEAAARAACCAEEQGELSAMADALFAAEEPTPEACEALAERIGLDMTAYRSCIESERPDERLAADLEDAKAVGVRGLPTFWIGDVRMEGLKDEIAVRGAVENALAQLTSSP